MEKSLLHIWIYHEWIVNHFEKLNAGHFQKIKYVTESFVYATLDAPTTE